MTDSIKERMQEEFLSELRALFCKWGAEMQLQNYNFTPLGHETKILVTISAEYEKDAELTMVYTDVDLGGYFTGDEDDN